MLLVNQTFKFDNKTVKYNNERAVIAMQIHEKLTEIRNEKGLKQWEVCSHLGISEMQLRRWEKGQSEMGIFKLKELCILYNVSADYILGLSNKKSRG